MKTKSRSLIVVFLMVFAFVCGVFAITPLTANAASSVRVDFCLTNGALENDVFFENNSSQYFLTQNTKNDGTLTYLEELYRTDNLDLEFDGWYTDKGEKVTLETVFTEYTILYDRWKETTLTDEDIISTLEIGTPLLEVGETAGTYGVNSITLTDNRLSIANVSVYEGLNAYRTNKLEDSDVLETGKSYSLRVELHTKNGELIDDQLMSHSTATYGLVANMVYSHDNSGIFTTQWTNRENKIQVIINYDFENYYFTSDLEDKVVENGQSPQYTVYVSNNANVQGMELFVKNANDTWASLGAVTGQFNIPANNNIVKQYRVEVTYQNGFVISSNTFSVDWYDPNAPKFITQPTDYDVAYGTNVLVTWGLNCSVSAIYLEKFNGETYSQYQNATPTGATVNAFAESGTYTFRVHAIKDGNDYYSDDFTIIWREKFVFTTQPQSHTVATGESYTITWATNQTPSVLQVYAEQGDGTYARSFNLAETAKEYTFSADMFGYVKNYKLYANYDGVGYFSDVFTRTVIAGEFTKKPDSEINAIVGKDYLVEWDFTLDVKYYNIKVHDGNDYVQFATTDKPEYVFTASEVGDKQFFIQAYNANDQIIGEDSLLFTIKWTEQQIVYLVSFNADGGEGTMASVEQNAGAEYTLPTCTFTAPDGKKFKAWSVNDVEKQVDDSITINANTVVKAVWEDNVYQVIYQPGDGNGSNEISEYEANQTITFLDCEVLGYTRDGFEFDYWSIRILGDNFIEVAQKGAGETYTLTNNIIAVAMWKEVTAVPTGITATYSGTILAGNKINPSSISIMLNYSNSSNEPVNAGIVEYWYNGSQIQDPINYVFGVELIGNLNITVKYQGFETTMAVQVVGYEITFNANTGSGTMESVEYVGAYTLPECEFTAPDGKQFKGWATSANGEVIDGATYNVTEPVTLYAIWENIPAVPTGLTASYNGTILAGNKIAINQLTVKLQYSDSSEMPCAGLCEYWYNGSKIDDPINYVFGVELIGTITITVKYQGFETTFDVQVVGYEITFNANTGSGTMESVEYVGAYTLPACTFTAPSGKQFKGWSTSISGEVIDGATYNVTANVELFAIWEDIPVVKYDVTFNANGGTGTMSPVEYAGTYTLPTCAFTAPDGKQFKGWSTSASGEVIDGATYNVTSNVELFAIWEDIPHNHVFGDWEVNQTHHWKECACGEEDEKAEHEDLDSDDLCDECGYDMTVEEESESESESEIESESENESESQSSSQGGTTSESLSESQPKLEEPKDGLSGGAIAGIVVGSVAVVGIGGFALVWFVIKKKSFADLIAIFKKK
ncbi:MAG: InlB B-repeat-containing protein [Clostridia bacterium]|nr:InlB B-repeat-containing protein [Clostridia bacterium]